MINIVSTMDYAESGTVKALVYGRPGIGKTTLCATAPTPVIISAEAGLMSLRKYDIPVLPIKGVADLYEVYNWCTESAEAESYETICIDSISEIAEQILAEEKENNKDFRRAYLFMQERMEKFIRLFRDLPNHNVYITCKMEKIMTDTGALVYGPALPGSKLAQNIGYFFDEVFAMIPFTDENGVTSRWLQTSADIKYEAKDRSGILNAFEFPDLTAIFKKIRGEETE